MNSYSNGPEEDDFAELLAQYQKLLAGEPASWLEEEAYERIIDHFDDQNQLKRALQAARFAVEKYPYSASLLVKKADLLIASRRFDEAMEELDRAELLDNHDINLYILRAEGHLAQGNQEAAESIVSIALDKFSGDEQLELLLELAEVFDDYEEYEKVFDCLKAILELFPTNEEALYKICFWTDFTGRNEEGIRLHQQILDEHPFNELAWFNLAAAYQGLRLYEKAIDAYKYAIAIDEKFDYAYRNMGDAYIRLRKYREAIDALIKVLELSQPEDILYEAIGHCYDKLHCYPQARDYYRKASELDAENSQLFYKVACTYMNEENWTSAVTELQTAMRMYRKQPEYNLAMGQCLAATEQYGEAIEYLSVAVKARSRNINYWMELLRCLYQAEYYEEGLQYILQARQFTQAKPVLYFYSAAFLFALYKPKEAMIQLETGLALNPRLIKKMRELDPSILQNPLILDALAKIRRK